MIWLWLALVIPSLDQVHKYAGWLGVAAYLAVTASAVALVPRLRALVLRLTERQSAWLGAATLLAVTLALVALYPVAQSLAIGPGSDSDDAHNVAVREMLHGRYPYYARTYLGNAVHDLPGFLLLSVPFVLLGNSAYANLFWLGAFLLDRKSVV